MRGPKRLLLVRHGAVDNPRDVVYGTLPGFALSSDGRSQMRGAARLMQLVPPVELVTSPLERALESALIIGSLVGVEPAIAVGLTEIRNSYEGRPRSEMQPVGGSGDLEAHNAVRDRVVAEIEKALRGGANTAVLVSHLLPIRLACIGLGLVGLPDLPPSGFHDLRVHLY